MRRVLVRFLEEIEDFKKTFRNYLTFSTSVKSLIEIWSCHVLEHLVIQFHRFYKRHSIIQSDLLKH